jgi:hypothetical protein
MGTSIRLLYSRIYGVDRVRSPVDTIGALFYPFALFPFFYFTILENIIPWDLTAVETAFIHTNPRRK